MRASLKFGSEHWIVIVAVIAIAIIASFDLALILPSLFHVRGLPTNVVYLYIVLFAGNMVSVFVIGPVLIYQFRQKLKLQDAINHYVKNKMQEIVLAVDLVESNLVKADAPEMTYKEKVEMLGDVRAICQDVSGNLAQKILANAPNFSYNIATDKEGFIGTDSKVKNKETSRSSRSAISMP